MTKKIYLVLILAIAGIASAKSAKAQMRISGEEIPNQSAVLDLNPDNNVLQGNATLGLALPRVNLRNSNDAFPLVAHIKGMTVYNMSTTGDVTQGLYINNGEKWLRQFDGNIPVTSDKDSIVGNEVTNATAGGGLSRSGTGTASSPYTLGIANSGVATSMIADNAVTSAKIADGTIVASDLSAMGATEGQVMKWIGSSWQPSVDMGITDVTAGGGLLRDGAGTTVSPYTLGIANNGVTTSMIADDAVTSAKIADGTIAASDLSSMGATEGQVMKWIGSSWQPSFDMGIISVSGDNGITVTNSITAPVVSLPSGTKGQTLVHNGTTWVAETPKKLSHVWITNTSTANNSVTANGYNDVYVWSDLQPGLYSLRVRAVGQIKFLLHSDVAFGTSTQFEINSNSHDNTAEIMFHYFYTGNLHLKAQCISGCPTRLFNLTLDKFE